MRTTASKLFEVLKDGLVTAQHIEISDKNTNECSTISAEKFIEDLEFYNSSGIFADSTDVICEFLNSGMAVKIGYMNTYSGKTIKAEMQIADGADSAILKSKLKIE